MRSVYCSMAEHSAAQKRPTRARPNRDHQTGRAQGRDRFAQSFQWAGEADGKDRSKRQCILEFRMISPKLRAYDYPLTLPSPPRSYVAISKSRVVIPNECEGS